MFEPNFENFSLTLHTGLRRDYEKNKNTFS